MSTWNAVKALVLSNFIASCLVSPASITKSSIYNWLHKSRYGRWKNVNEMFSLNLRYSLKDKHVLLVDDVFTTGATLIACADAMKSVSGIRISVLTLALAGET